MGKLLVRDIRFLRIPRDLLAALGGPPLAKLESAEDSTCDILGSRSRRASSGRAVLAECFRARREPIWQGVERYQVLGLKVSQLM